MKKPNQTLKVARLEAGLTQEELADLLGVTSLTIYRWERGDNDPTPFWRTRLCQLLQIPARELGWPDQPAESLGTTGTPPIRTAEVLVDPALPMSSCLPIGQDALVQDLAAAPQQRIGLTGLPGSGKTRVALALAASPEMRQQVRVILWATVGQEPHPLRHLRRWLRLLGHATVPTCLEEAHDLLRVQLHGEQVLLVLDDVWEARDLLPYHLSAQDRLLVTTRLPAVAHSLCEVVARPRALTETQAMQWLSQGLPTPLVRAHRALLRTLSQQVGCLPAALEQIGSVLQQAARTHSPRRWHEAFTSLMQPATCLHLALPPASCSLAESIERSEAWLPASSRQALRFLAAHFSAAPATFTEAQVVSRLQGAGSCSLSDLDHLVDAGLLDANGPDRYQLHPVIAAYARLVMQEQETGGARP